jgi:hypothetical protein
LLQSNPAKAESDRSEIVSERKKADELLNRHEQLLQPGQKMMFASCGPASGRIGIFCLRRLRGTRQHGLLREKGAGGIPTKAMFCEP